MIMATAGTPCTPLVRIAANEPWLAKAPMDFGAMGINFPMINSADDAYKAARSLRYPTQGERLWDRSMRRSAGTSACPTIWRAPTTA